ncbi:Peptidyl-prolyl cis-trans isomerase [Paramagnetospirillum magnetotacticum MS-1]|uniref:Peptidyl-prolyl cis-trans isomerase n=1 Tax=Paramagnetospirillum magnetotacticum MS-1 TaxID=272627 RepID=A0A0C2V175_PARME|nr:peptidylprolyl isomerase [Paramagnetospirillum magnetotacticum]KIL98826.1 Peptidyl-prolyl cis-trans isomerase [Paramagnetospirillum magnetotacticum MS-1]
MLKRLLIAAATLILFAVQPAQAADPENTLVLELATGTVTVELRPDLAPKHVARVKELVRKGFYDGTVFHRVIPGFMAQGGDPTGTGTGGSGVKLRAEFTGEPFVRGVVGMARSASPDSADSQFFIMFGSAPSLDGRYTAIGRVVEGMESVDRIKAGDPADNGIVSKPDKLIRIQVLADIRK